MGAPGGGFVAEPRAKNQEPRNCGTELSKRTSEQKNIERLFPPFGGLTALVHAAILANKLNHTAVIRKSTH
jgi:hypothetical protein